jgi:hypothetical protein
MRRRWIQQPDGELQEVGDDYQAAPRSNTDAALWNDRLYQDGNDAIKSRSQHRDYMRQHGLTTVDDFSGQWRKNEEQRIKVRQGIDPTRRDAIQRSIQKLNGA